MRAEARGGSGEGILGWNRKAVSAYTWCVTEKGPQRKWLHKIKKKDTPKCNCGLQEQSGEHRVERCEQLEQSGEHLVERCRLLADKREMVERKELREWRTRHSRRQNKKEKGPVEPGKEEEDKLESFFSHLYEFHNPVLVTPHVVSFTPAAIPRYASASASASVSAFDVPVSAPALLVSSAVPVNPPSCIGTTQ